MEKFSTKTLSSTEIDNRLRNPNKFLIKLIDWKNEKIRKQF